MSDEVIIASTTDSAEQIQAAMDHGVALPNDEAVLAVVDDEPAAVEKVEAEGAGKVEAKTEPTDEEKKAAAEKKVAAEKKELELKAKEELGERATKRINKLVAEREEANRRADAAEARAKAAEDAGKKTAEKVEEVATADVDAAWLTKNPEPQQENFPDYDAFVKDWTKWEMGRQRAITVREAEEAGRKGAEKVLGDRAAKDAAEREAADRTELFQKFEAGKEEARTRYDDFDTVIEGAKDLQLSGPMQFVIMDSAVGHDMAYWLAQPANREEAEHLASLEGAEAIRELGRLERTIELHVASRDEAAPGAVVDEKPAKVVPVKKVAATKATAPIVPVGSRGVATTDVLDPNVDYQTYKAQMNKRDFERRKRR